MNLLRIVLSLLCFCQSAFGGGIIPFMFLPAASTSEPACSNAKVTFTYTGSNQTVVVPAGCSSAIVKAWGAGGGAATYGASYSGGGGGYASTSISVNANETLTVVVGQGGSGSTSGVSARYGGGGSTGAATYAGGAGGGRSAVLRSGVDLITAGGGGGGGHGATGGAGGGIAGTTYSSAVGGAPGTTSAGGNGGTGTVAGGAGTSQTGGNGAVSGSTGSGGGGGGYYGGGAGGAQSSTGGGGGGGGANYAPGGTVTNGSGVSVANNGDADYSAGVGTGGGTGGAAGGNGRVVIQWSGPVALAISPSSPSVSVNTTANFTATGGSFPYTFSVSSGSGTINSSTGVYTAPASTGTDTVLVTDSLGNTAQATVNVVACVANPNPSQVKALLHLNGSVGGNTFTSSLGSPTITLSGTPTTQGSGYVAEAGYFNTGYLTMNSQPALGVGSSDFTMEFWVKPNSGSYPGFDWNAAGQTSQIAAIAINESGQVYFSTGGGWTGGPIAIGASNGVWSHVAISRQGTNIYVFTNGTLKGTYAVGSGSLATYTYNTFGRYSAASTGYLDEFRLTIGTGLYGPSNFTAPVGQFCDN